VQDTLEYFASFRERWNTTTEAALRDRFDLDPSAKTSHLSKGQRTQLALVTAVCAEPELLVLDEPTSGLDPIVRREFIQTVIGAYQQELPGERTVFVSTHLIAEFEGLIDEFTIIDKGREVVTLEADAARQRFQRIRARFATDPGPLALPGARIVSHQGRDVALEVDGTGRDVLERLRTLDLESVTAESLTLEEIFVSALRAREAVA
jgi:ABC-2 type transport system ATP-binding protein